MAALAKSHETWSRRRALVFLFGCGLFLSAGSARAVDFIAGIGLADADGQGVISFRIDPSVGEMITAGSTRQKMTLSGGARVRSVSVEAGVVHVAFENAKPDTWIDARLPEDAYGETGNTQPSMIGDSAVIKKQAVLGHDPAGPNGR